jgi:hypothetical protein
MLVAKPNERRNSCQIRLSTPPSCRSLGAGRSTINNQLSTFPWYDRIVYALVAVAILLIAAMSILLFRFIFN